jgi:hypothetical protein
MKVCKKHIKYLQPGVTYQLVSERDCLLCNDLRVERLEGELGGY